MRSSTSTAILHRSTYFSGGKKLRFEKYQCFTFPSTLVLAKHFQSDKHFNVSTRFYVSLRTSLLGSYSAAGVSKEFTISIYKGEMF